MKDLDAALASSGKDRVFNSLCLWGEAVGSFRRLKPEACVLRAACWLLSRM